MNPNQNLFCIPASVEVSARPGQFSLSSLLDELFGGTPVTTPRTYTAGLDDPFANGWNAAMRHMRGNPPTPALLPLPTNVIFNDPATIVYWDDGTKTVVKCQPGDVFSAETGLTTAMVKKYMGNDNTFNRVINEWLKHTGEYKPSVAPALPAAETPAALPAPTDQGAPEMVE